jgi:tripartite-type tricarboxylate transporter receptor subunit TctC
MKIGRIGMVLGAWLTFLAVPVLAILGLAVPGTAIAQQNFPDQPIRLINPYSVGSVADVFGRIVAQNMAEQWKGTILAESKSGGNGSIAAEEVARAAPDGYTWLLVTTFFTASPSLNVGLRWDPVRDFIPIGQICRAPNFFVVPTTLPAKSVAEYVALAKEKPGKLNFASSGYGAAAHLAGELFKADAHIDIVHVAYKGAAPALQDVIAGHVDMMFATSASVLAYIKDGLVRPLAVTTLKRSALLPDLPTIAESGLPDFDANTWHGLVAPAGTPKEVIDTLNRAAISALDDPDVRKALGNLGVDVAGSSPQEFDAYIKTEIPKWSAVVKAAGAKVE